jgi:hypothetical protein
MRTTSVLSALFVTVFVACFFIVPGPRVDAASATVSPDPFYGTWYDLMSPTPQVARTDLDRMKAAGVGFVRQYIWWDRIETSPGVFDWGRADAMVADASSRGIRILPTLLYPPTFYSSKPPGSTSTAQFPPADPTKMADFAEAMIRRYGPDGAFWCTPNPPLPPNCRSPYLPMHSWEVWNEPDYPSWWKGAPSAPEYLELLQVVSARIRSTDPTAEVVLGSLTNRNSVPDSFLGQLFDLGAAPSFDTIAFNPYSRDIKTLVGHMRGIRDLTVQKGDGTVPIWVTEYGWATLGDESRVLWSTSEPCQAAMLHAATTRLAALSTELNIEHITQFQWHDVPIASSAWPHYTGLYRADDTAKPSHEAFAAAIAGRPAPAGATIDESCPADKRDQGPAGTKPLAVDTFSRTVSDGWGSAETGGPYATGTGTGASFSVSGGSGRVTVPAAGVSRQALLGSASSANVDLHISVATDKAATDGAAQIFTLVTRRDEAGDEYRIRARFVADGVRLGVAKIVGGVSSDVGGEVLVAGLTRVVGEPIVLRAQVKGKQPATIKVKAWAASKPEPSDWVLTQTDTDAALEGPGLVGVRASLSSGLLSGPVTFTVDNLHATAPK